MNKKIIATAGAGVTGAILLGVGFVIRNKNKKEQEELTEEQVMEFMKDSLRAFIKENKVSKYDLKTIKYIEKLNKKLKDKKLDEEKLDVLFSEV